MNSNLDKHYDCRVDSNVMVDIYCPTGRLTEQDSIAKGVAIVYIPYWQPNSPRTAIVA